MSTSTFAIKEVLTGAVAGSVLDPMQRDTYNLICGLNMLSPMFPESELVKLDLEPLLQGILEDVRLQILC